MRFSSKMVGIAALLAGLSGTAWAQSCPAPVAVGAAQEVTFSHGKFSLTPTVDGLSIQVDTISPVTGETESQSVRIYNDGSGRPTGGSINVNSYSFDSSFNLGGEITATLGASYDAVGNLRIGYGSKDDNFLQIIDGTSHCFTFPTPALFGNATKEITIIGTDLLDVAHGVQALNAQLAQCVSDRDGLRVSLTNTQAALAQCELDKANLQATIALRDARIAELEAIIAALRAQLAALSNQSTSRSVYDLGKMISSLRKTAKFALEQSRLSKIEKRMKRMSKIAKLAKKANGLNIKSGDSAISVTSTSVPQ